MPILTKFSGNIADVKNLISLLLQEYQLLRRLCTRAGLDRAFFALELGDHQTNINRRMRPGLDAENVRRIQT